MKSFNEWLSKKGDTGSEVNEIFGLFGPKLQRVYNVKSFIDEVEQKLGDDFVVTHSRSSSKPMSVRQVVIEAYRDLFTSYAGYGDELKAMHGSKGPKQYNMFGSAVVEKDPTSLQKLIFAIGKFEGEEHENKALEIREKLINDLVSKIRKEHDLEGRSTSPYAVGRSVRTLGSPNARDVSGGEYNDDTRYVSARDLERINRSRHMGT